MIDPLRGGYLFSPAAHGAAAVGNDVDQAATRRTALQQLAGRMRALDTRLDAACVAVESQQSRLRLACGNVPDLGTDTYRPYSHLASLQEELGRLAANNRRFTMVIDLMLAAAQLLEPSTSRLAEGFMGVHIAQCEAVLCRADQLVDSLPKDA